MKTSYYFRKAMLLTSFMAGIVSLSAKDVYVSATGSDSNDGQSESTAVATLRAAIGKANDGDVIKVIGVIKTTADEVEVDGISLAFEGVGTDACFDGDNKNPIMTIYGPTEKKVSFKDIAFKNAFRSFGGHGGAINIDGDLVVHFSSCFFENNKTDLMNGSDGGAIRANDASLSLYDCMFTGNAGYAGGAIKTQGSSHLTVDYCSFMDNYTENATGQYEGDTRGGAMCIYGELGYILRNTIIAYNECRTDGMGGGIATDCSGYIEGCSFIDNTLHGHGGAMAFLKNECNTTVVNTTFTGNQTNGAGGVVFIACNYVTLKLVNVTATNNASHSNSGNGGGFRIMNPIKLEVINSVIEGNMALHSEDGGTQPPEICDFILNGVADLQLGTFTELKFVNSIVGVFTGAGEILSMDCDITNSRVDEYYVDDDYYDVALSGITLDGASYTDRGQVYYYLEKDALAKDFGETKYLTELDVAWDQLGAPRTGEKCSAGAVEATNSKADDQDIPEDPFFTTGISRTVKSNISVYPNPAVDYIRIDMEEELLSAELISVNGQIVKSFTVEKELDVMNVSAGLYILKIVTNSGVYTETIIVQ